MGTKNRGFRTGFKNAVALIAASSLVACGGGDPSISVLPSLDSFEQEGSEVTAKMDILWVIDNSGSMAPYQQELKDKFESFIQNFTGKGYDYRMAVTTTDAWATKSQNYNDTSFINPSTSCDGGIGRSVSLSSKFLDGNYYDGATGFPLIVSDDPLIDFSLDNSVSDTDSTDDIESIFSANIGQGTCGSGAEKGLESLKTALNNPFNQSSYDFPRSDAHLAVIVVTDEEDVIATYDHDGLPGTPEVEYSVASYKDFLDGVSSSEFGYSFHTIAVLEGEAENTVSSSPCFRDEDDNPSTPKTSILHAAASESIRYSELSELSGGVVASVCSPFDETLQNIAQTIIESTVEFALSEVPLNPEALQILVKNPGALDFTRVARGEENGWSYNASSNSIVFKGTAIPAQGAVIKILYDPDSL